MKVSGVVIFLLFLLCAGNAAAGDREADSLLQILKTNVQDTLRVKILNELSRVDGWKVGNYEKALKYANSALKLASEIRFKQGMGDAYNNLGATYDDKGNYTDALVNYFAALKIREELGNKKSIASSYNNIGKIYGYQGNNNEALKSHFASLKIKKELGDKKGIGVSYNNIGTIYYSQEEFPKALEYYFASLEIKEELHDKIGVATLCNNIGNVYNYQGNYSESLKMHFRSLKIREEMGDKEGLASSYCNIGPVYTKLNKAREGKIWLMKALVLAKELGAKARMKNIYAGLADADSALGNYKDAFMYYRMFVSTKDSIINEETKKKTFQQSMQYEFDKKEASLKAAQEKKDALALAKSKEERITLYAVSGLGILMFVFVLVIFRNLRLNQEKNKIISEQKFIVEEKHKEITDSINYAVRIQRSFLATKELLDEHLRDYFVFFRPKDVVSGDFYWAYKMSDGRFIWVTADSTGHGVPGAIMSILNISSLEKAVEKETEPSAILNTTRSLIIDRLKQDGTEDGGKDGMDCSVCMIDKSKMQLIVAASYSPVWIIRGNETIEIKPDKMPVGKHDKQHIPFRQQTIDLKQGDVIYSLTDGFADQFGGERGKKFMSKSLRSLLASNSHLSMPEQKQLLDSTFKSWKGDFAQIDDVTIIGVRV